MDRNTIKYQQKEISYAAVTAAGTKTDSFDVDEDFKWITGIYIKEITDGDLVDEYEVGLSDDRGSLIDVVNKTVLEANASVSPDEKFLDAKFPIRKGMSLKVLTKFDSATATDALNFLVVLRLEGRAEEG